MKSKTSFFNAGIAKNLWKRFWPVWTFYFALIMFELPLSLNGEISQYCVNSRNLSVFVENNVLSNGCNVAVCSFAFSIMVVMAMFSFLYFNRTCSMMCSFPVSRQSLFATVWLTGITPMIAADIITAAVTLSAYSKLVSLKLILKWLAIAAMGNVGFYGMGSFCAMLTGNIIVLPLVYLVLNMTAYIAESSIQVIIQNLVFGYSYGKSSLGFLSPIAKISSELYATTDYYSEETGTFIDSGTVILNGTEYLACFCVAGLIMSALAFVLFKNRRMETVSDAVAVPVLKPVFKYCMAFGGAIVLAAFAFETYLSDGCIGESAAFATLALMLAGAFIGYFAALMIMKKTLHVFKGEFKGLIPVMAICTAFVILCETDATGYEKRLPDRTDIESFQIYCANGYGEIIEEPENIDSALELHESIVSNKKLHEKTLDTQAVTIDWTLKGGEHLHRYWLISAEDEELLSDQSDIRKAALIENCAEAVLKRYTPDIELKEENIQEAWISTYTEDEVGYYEDYYPLSAEEAIMLYNSCIIPDIKNGRIGNNTWINESQGSSRLTGIYINISLRDRALSTAEEPYTDNLWIEVLQDSELTLKAVEEFMQKAK